MQYRYRFITKTRAKEVQLFYYSMLRYVIVKHIGQAFALRKNDSFVCQEIYISRNIELYIVLLT